MKNLNEILDVLGQKLVSIGEVTVTPVLLITMGLIVVAAFVSSVLVQRIMRRNLLRRVGLKQGAQESICRALHYVIILAGAFIAIDQAGIDLTALAALSAVLMVGLGIGLQNITSNFVSGLILLLERPVQVGDFVEVSGVQGSVRTIRGRSTMVETLDNVSIIVPNSHFITQNVTNWSYRDEKVRIHVNVGVSYGADVDLVEETLLKVGDAHPEVLRDPEPRVQFLNFGDSSLNFVLLVWIDIPARQNFVRSDLNFAVVKAFREENITIPFPQRDLHLRTGYNPASV